MLEDDRPLVLLVCEDSARLARVRQQVREARFLSASGRSVEGAVHLLTQVRVDACVLLQPVTGEQAGALTEALERARPGCPRFFTGELQDASLRGWTACREEQVAGALEEVLGVYR